jgi:hypothetical protein
MENEITEMDKLINKYVEEYPDAFYEKLLLGPLTNIYSARKQSEYSDWMNYASLLIDKFAIHSLSFFHLSQGIVERKNDGTVRKGKGYDVFSINALFRVMMETYIAFNWIYVSPKTVEEKEFRFLLWKLDGLFEKRKFEFTEDIKRESADILAKDEAEKKETIERLKNCSFYKSLPQKEIDKVLDTAKNRANWKCELLTGDKLRSLKIINLVQIVCKTDTFLNMYRYTSMFTHSNYVGVDQFRQMRGKRVADDYAEPLIKVAIFLTALIIDDMCITDKNAARVFSEQELYLQRFITKMSAQLKKTPAKPLI